jgi:hypothetical protein
VHTTPRFQQVLQVGLNLEESQAPHVDKHGLPVWIELPASGKREFYTGLSRSALNALILPTKANGFRPPVKSISLKSSPHVTRGKRLILLSSLLAYLESLSR